ncbi:hypothetical protein GUJ93_ZPchr0013g35197 [Zizania palustris]|uniref:HAUS augmin-like complex subunit 3 N-terminal domain-containing protein n=1 Tax=Zizania palustris TaxID=103762 RepID=A0A8J5X5J9_ZIZPA|nr:hypothetical protein GUJ93_ZPchr0013g35197 [Zizania palustris]
MPMSSPHTLILLLLVLGAQPRLSTSSFSPIRPHFLGALHVFFLSSVATGGDIRYEQLELEEKVLKGEDLDFAFDSISAFSEIGDNQEDIFLTEESIEHIRDSKLALRAEVSDLEKKLASLEWQLDLLTAQATSITHRKKSRSSAKTRPNGQTARLDEKLAKRNLELELKSVFRITP